jgi:hypothetical protein
MAFSFGVEMLNLKLRKHEKAVKLHQIYDDELQEAEKTQSRDEAKYGN